MNGTPMLDLIFIAATVLSLALCAIYLLACAKL